MAFNVKCTFCGADLKKKNRTKTGNYFCNNECRGNWLKTQKPWNFKGKVATTCDICGKEFYRLESKIKPNKYCSRECYAEAERRQTGELHPLYERTEAPCEVCGKVIGKSSYRLNRAKHHFCSIECKRQWNIDIHANPDNKICTKCLMEYPATTEYFHKNKNERDGLYHTCKACRNTMARTEYENRKDYYKSYAKANESKLKDARKQYNALNKDKLKEKYMVNRDKYNAKKAIYYREHKEEQKEQRKAYYKYYTSTERGREVLRLSSHKRRARNKALIDDFTVEQWTAAKIYFDHKCVYCGKPSKRLTQEHFVPVSKGGHYTVFNIIPACKSCNSSKCDEDFSSWYPKQPFYNKEQETKILNYIEYQKSIYIAPKQDAISF
jgi:endogenous inhibitor of DNA gyrase (YacG/DUF329 family)